MTGQLLLPNQFKKLGWLLLIPSTIAGILIAMNRFEVSWIKLDVFALFSGNSISGHGEIGNNENFSFITTDVTFTLVGSLFIIGGLLVSFSKEKIEDEFISKLRLSSLLWSVWVNYILLLLTFLFVYGFSFMHVMIYNMFTVLIIFIIRFNFLLYKNSKMAGDEK